MRKPGRGGGRRRSGEGIWAEAEARDLGRGVEGVDPDEKRRFSFFCRYFKKLNFEGEYKIEFNSKN